MLLKDAAGIANSDIVNDQTAPQLHTVKTLIRLLLWAWPVSKSLNGTSTSTEQIANSCEIYFSMFFNIQSGY